MPGPEKQAPALLQKSMSENSRKKKAGGPEDSLKSALKSLIRFLARRPYSEKELKERLLKKFPPEAAEWALAEAKKRGFMQPAGELAEMFARSLHEKNKGWLYIKSRLRQRGLPCPEYNRERELKKARALLEKKRLSAAAGAPAAGRQKAARALRARGFEGEILRALLSGLSD